MPDLSGTMTTPDTAADEQRAAAANVVRAWVDNPDDRDTILDMLGLEK